MKCRKCIFISLVHKVTFQTQSIDLLCFLSQNCFFLMKKNPLFYTHITPKVTIPFISKIIITVSIKKSITTIYSLYITQKVTWTDFSHQFVIIKLYSKNIDIAYNLWKINAENLKTLKRCVYCKTLNIDRNYL